MRRGWGDVRDAWSTWVSRGSHEGPTSRTSRFAALPLHAQFLRLDARRLSRPFAAPRRPATSTPCSRAKPAQRPLTPARACHACISRLPATCLARSPSPRMPNPGIRGIGRLSERSTCPASSRPSQVEDASYPRGPCTPRAAETDCSRRRQAHERQRWPWAVARTPAVPVPTIPAAARGCRLAGRRIPGSLYASAPIAFPPGRVSRATRGATKAGTRRASRTWRSSCADRPAGAPLQCSISRPHQWRGARDGARGGTGHPLAAGSVSPCRLRHRPDDTTRLHHCFGLIQITRVGFVTTGCEAVGTRAVLSRLVERAERGGERSE